MKAWMFYSWLEDYSEQSKVLENQGYLIGSFFNPEAVRKILGAGIEQHISSDEEFEEVFNRLGDFDTRPKEDKTSDKPKRKRRLKKS